MYQPSDFIPSNLEINNWEDLQPYVEKLIEHPINSDQDLQDLILYYSEVISVFAEQYAWSYIKMSCDTKNKAHVKRYDNFSSVINPEVSKAGNIVDKKITGSEYFSSLSPERYGQLTKILNRDLEMFRDENVPIKAEISKLSSKFDQLAGGLTANINGKELPLPIAGKMLQSSNREERFTAWKAIQECRYKHANEFDDIYSNMIKKRHQVALNAGYENYRDFQHDNLHRFDYTPENTLVFHDAVEKFVVPLAREIDQRNREKLNLTEDDFRPWDQSGEPEGKEPLKPFEGGEELVNKAIDIFSALKPEFGQNLQAMKDNRLFDLESRNGKAPGGYNYPLEVTGMPFIFMNAAGTQRDVTTMVHEGGHAMHTFLCNNEPLVQYRGTPSEMAETASMSMELMTSPYWDKFYSKEDHIRARREHLEGIISFFPWCATVDAFQHWIYLNPDHTVEERDDYFVELSNRFGSTIVNWDKYEHYHRKGWQRQSHIFGVPFYYIEYGIAQLGALQVYRNFVHDQESGLKGYIAGLSMGNSKPMPEIWDKMGIKFDFSVETIRELMNFVQDELDKLSEVELASY